ncbi:MAG: ribonuclease P protein component [Cyanobacteria bacterium P01_D01_bin.105]
MALPKQHRLGSNQDFNQVHRKGLRASTQHLAMRALSISRIQKKRPPKLKPSIGESADGESIDRKSAEGEPSALLCAQKTAVVEPDARPAFEPLALMPSQFGISISKKVSKRAVVRNRIKRQIKAVIHQRLSAIAPGWKVVIVVRPSAVECEFADFLRELEYLLKKLRITKPIHND